MLKLFHGTILGLGGDEIGKVISHPMMLSSAISFHIIHISLQASIFVFADAQETDTCLQVSVNHVYKSHEYL